LRQARTPVIVFPNAQHRILVRSGCPQNCRIGDWLPKSVVPSWKGTEKKFRACYLDRPDGVIGLIVLDFPLTALHGGSEPVWVRVD
jgi:hypothetical protein